MFIKKSMTRPCLSEDIVDLCISKVQTHTERCFMQNKLIAQRVNIFVLNDVIVHIVTEFGIEQYLINVKNGKLREQFTQFST